MSVVTENLDLWTSALLVKSSAGRGSGGKIEAYGIKKLRELILELAVRGKLVPQDPNDEPASVLLERIAAEKERLLDEEEVGRGKPVPEIGAADTSPGVPPGWRVVRFGALIFLVSGQHLKPEEYSSNQSAGMIPYLTGPAEFAETYPQPTRYTNEKRAIAEPGDVLITCKGSGVGKTNIANIQMAISRQLMSIRPIIVSTEFIKLITDSLEEAIRQNIVGIAIPGISREDVLHAVIQLPPLAEQHRIVAKVDELMALCDRLEEEQTDSIEAHETLVETLLGTLTRAKSSEEFIEAWARISEHFDILFTTENSIDQLKQTILQLAVMGKLVPQDPSDEPASVLLQKIASEKARMAKEGVIRKQKPLPVVSDGEKPYALPLCWEWVRLPEIYFSISPNGSKLLSSAIKDAGTFPVVDQGQRYIAGYTDDAALLINLPGPVIVFGDHTTERKYIDFDFVAGADGVKILRPILQDELFFFRQLQGYRLEERGYARHFKVLNDNLYALPPIEEQHRIVAKVDELMAICDSLKERLNEARETRIFLADAIVTRAVA